MKKVIFAMMLALIGLASCNQAEVQQDSFVVVSVKCRNHNMLWNKLYEVELATSQNDEDIPIILRTDIPYKVGDIVELKKK